MELDGRPFYVFDNPGTFTLPPGTYSVSGGTWLGPMPKRKAADLPAVTRYRIPKRVRIVFATNPRKAVISLPDGVIVVDHSLRRLPEFALVFILFHEIGHYFFADEEGCDRFAAEEMLRRGYNASQVRAAMLTTMRHEGRLKCNLQTLINR